MSDKELLELAAKAAGLGVKLCLDDHYKSCIYGGSLPSTKYTTPTFTPPTVAQSSVLPLKLEGV